ncbi:PIG-L deacetylase family protein [Streptomyces sp. NPDC003442]
MARIATVLAFHAHPDDEALLTGGTLARLADEGHRVVLVVATDGHMDAAPENGEPPRMRELRASAAILGVDRVVHLGYADSGHGGRMSAVMRRMLRLPAPLFGLLLGREWFIDASPPGPRDASCRRTDPRRGRRSQHGPARRRGGPDPCTTEYGHGSRP